MPKKMVMNVKEVENLPSDLKEEKAQAHVKTEEQKREHVQSGRSFYRISSGCLAEAAILSLDC